MDEYHLILLPSNDVQLLIIFFFAIEFFFSNNTWAYSNMGLCHSNTQVPDLWVYKVYIIHQPYHKS